MAVAAGMRRRVRRRRARTRTTSGSGRERGKPLSAYGMNGYTLGA